jgi:hypothetical protein
MRNFYVTDWQVEGPLDGQLRIAMVTDVRHPSFRHFFVVVAIAIRLSLNFARVKTVQDNP